MEPIPDNGERNFDIDKAKHTHCEYEHESFTIKKKHPLEEFWKFIAQSAGGFVKCFVGCIAEVAVKPTAQRCGLGTIFTTLCLVDADMNGPYGNVNGNLACQSVCPSLTKDVRIVTLVYPLAIQCSDYDIP